MFLDGRLNKQDTTTVGLCGAVKMLVLGRPSHDVSQVGLGPRRLGPLLVRVSAVSVFGGASMSGLEVLLILKSHSLNGYGIWSVLLPF